MKTKSSGKIAIRNQPCLDPSCGSSDARQIYEDGGSYCFSCNKSFREGDGALESRNIKVYNKGYTNTLADIKTYPSKQLKDRKIEEDIMEYYGVKVSFDEDGQIDSHYYPYDEGKAYKKRSLPKDFSWIGNSKSLFGMDKFTAGGKRVVVTEGEIDTLSIAQAYKLHYGKLFPVVSLQSATILKPLIENREWLRKFDEVILCFDQDEAGQKALVEACKIVGSDKAKIAKLPLKDANDVLQVKNGWKEIMSSIFNAQPYVPSGIIGKDALWEALTAYNEIESVPYPPCLGGVNAKIKGMRPGEITLFIAGTGSGKSTLLRETMLHLILTTQDKIGVVSLEESPAETARKLAGMAINRNPAEEEIPIEDLKVGFDTVFGDDRVVVLDHQGSVNDNSIIDKLEYMCLVGCKYIFIDHITILVSEGLENLTGNEAQDKVMNDLLRLVKRHPVWIGLVSHLRKTPNNSKAFEEGKLPSLDDIRGSGSVKQISFDIISFARNLTADNEVERNTIKMRVLKSRFTGLTGNVKGARYQYETGRLICIEDDIIEEFVSE